MRNNAEYQLCTNIAQYMRSQYPKVIYRFDMAGLNLSKASAGMNKAIQFGKGYPDFQILEARQIDSIRYNGLFMELKKEGTKLFKKNGEYVTEHIAEQHIFITKLRAKDYWATFAIGFDQAKYTIDRYLKGEIVGVIEGQF